MTIPGLSHSLEGILLKPTRIDTLKDLDVSGLVDLPRASSQPYNLPDNSVFWSERDTPRRGLLKELHSYSIKTMVHPARSSYQG
jgi:hypothetical protein